MLLNIFAQATPSLPPIELITQLAAIFISHPWSIGVFLVILAIFWNYAKILDFVKHFVNKKIENESKRLEEIKNLNDKHFSLYESQTEVLKGVAQALIELKEFLLGFEGRIVEKIASSEQRVSDKITASETRLSDKIIDNHP